MGVVNLIGSSAYDPSVMPRTPLPAEITQGHVRSLGGTTELANGNSATSTIDMGEIPSSARILRKSDVYGDAIAGNTSVSVGLGTRAGGINGALTVKSANCLLNAYDLHLGGVVNLTAIDYADVAKAAWQLAGYTNDPGGMLHVIGTIGNDVTAAGTISWEILFKTV